MIKASEIEMKIIKCLHDLDVDDLVELHNHIFPTEIINPQEVENDG